ncbi:FtsW/RodA/SpoVE family cell cycle protein, partial [Nonomuraea sp. NPDC055795]
MWDNGAGEVLAAFGDTFGDGWAPPGANGGDWRSQVLLRSSDRDLAYGMTFSSAATDRAGHAKELIPSRKVDGDEITVIPTAGVSVGTRQYMGYMSVRHWGQPGQWDTNYAGIAYSDDNGQNWTATTPGTPRWDNPGGGNHFQMAAMVRRDGYIHLFATPNGRSGAAYLARVPEHQILGLMMVLSASSIEALNKTGSPFSWFIRQTVSAAIGVPVMYLCSRLPHKFFRWAGYPLMVLSIIALVMVLFIGSSELGAQRWIYIGPLTVQPSEPAKLGLALWGADMLARRARAGRIEWRQMLIPLMPGTAILAVMVMLGRDLGTTLVLMMIFLSLLWVVGAPVKLFGGILGVAVLAAVIMIKVEPYRMARIGAFLDPWAEAQGAGYQAVQGQIAMGSGGWFGLGLGSSRQKWSWLPHGESDFIFAILGEELGLMGTLVETAVSTAQSGLSAAQGTL